MFSNVSFDLDMAKDDNSPMGLAHDRLNRILNALARYSYHASLNKNETMEFPQDFDESIGGQCLILDAYVKNGQGLEINNRQFGLMLAINIHRSEMEFARKNGGETLLELLKKKGIYPYSNLDRNPVV